MECLACQTGAMSVINLAEHFKAMKFVCRLCDDSGAVSGGNGERLCKHVVSPWHREMLVEEQMRYQGVASPLRPGCTRETAKVSCACEGASRCPLPYVGLGPRGESFRRVLTNRPRRQAARALGGPSVFGSWVWPLLSVRFFVLTMCLFCVPRTRTRAGALRFVYSPSQNVKCARTGSLYTTISRYLALF